MLRSSFLSPPEFSARSRAQPAISMTLQLRRLGLQANLGKRASSCRVLAVKRSHSTTPTRLTLSSVAGPTVPPLLQETLPVYFSSQILPSYSDRPALISKHEKPRAHGGPLVQTDHWSKNLSWNFEEMDKAVAALARGLVKMGVREGDRVGVILGNNRCDELAHQKRLV